MTSLTLRRLVFLIITGLIAVVLIGIPGEFALPLFMVMSLAAAMTAAYRFWPPMLLKQILAQHLRTIILMIVPLIPWLLFLITGLRGIDFGPKHVDEPLQLEIAIQTLKSGVLIPDFYNYPSMSYWLTLTALLPEIHQIRTGNLNPAHFIETHWYPYMLRVRRIFLSVSSLAILWVYGAVLAWRDRDGDEAKGENGNGWREAFIATIILGFSQEIAYHARWIAPDTVLMQYGALTVLFCMIAIRNQNSYSKALIAAGISAGLGTGTKYPGGLLMLPVLIAAFPALRRMTWYQAGWRIFGLMIAAGGAYLLTTPGTLLAPGEFMADVHYELDHYRVFGHDIHTVTPGLEHLRLNIDYLTRAGFSSYEAIALLFAALTAIGAFAALRKDIQSGLILVSFPVVYVLYFSQQRVMFVRNLLVVLPFCAILAAHGAFFLIDLPKKLLKKSRWNVLLQYSAMIVLVILPGLNAKTLITDAESIRQPDERQDFLDFAGYVIDHPDAHFAASDEVWKTFRRFDIQIPENIAHATWDDADTGAFFSDEIGLHLPPNRVDTFLRWFGSHETNYNIYPYWRGHHVMLLSKEKIKIYNLPP